MTYTDAKEYLHIAENAYGVEAYAEAAEIVAKVARAVAFDTAMPKIQRDEIVNNVKSQIARFQFCPDEGCWEVVSELSDLFRAE
jgi:hypothetical protein